MKISIVSWAQELSAWPSLSRVVTKISSCLVNTTSWWGINQLGISYGSIFLLFSNKSSWGKSPAPLSSWQKWKLSPNGCLFSPYPVEELNSLVFGPKQLWIGGREGAYIFCSMEIVVWCKNCVRFASGCRCSIPSLAVMAFISNNSKYFSDNLACK